MHGRHKLPRGVWEHTFPPPLKIYKKEHSETLGAFHLVKNSKSFRLGWFTRPENSRKKWNCSHFTLHSNQLSLLIKLSRFPGWNVPAGFARSSCNISIIFTSSRPTAINLSLPFRKQNGGRDYDVLVSVCVACSQPPPWSIY